RRRCRAGAGPRRARRRARAGSARVQLSSRKRAYLPPSPGEGMRHWAGDRKEEGAHVAKRVAINGFGRIGRIFFRAYLKQEPDFEVVAVNDLAPPDVLAHMLKYDSTHGVLDADIGHDEDELSVNGRNVRVTSDKDPAALPWGEMEVDVVVESTGLFTDRDGAAQHLTAGAKKVVISAPATDPDLTIVPGVNADDYDPAQHNIIANASCTTNSVAPMGQVLQAEFGGRLGLLTTI